MKDFNGETRKVGLTRIDHNEIIKKIFVTVEITEYQYSGANLQKLHI